MHWFKFQSIFYNYLFDEMRKLVFLVILNVTLTLFCCCNDTNIVNPDTNMFRIYKEGECVAPSWTKEYSMVSFPYIYSKVTSFNGKYMIYEYDNSDEYYLLNTITRESTIIDFDSMLPTNMKCLSIASWVSCPYDESKYLCLMLIETDTIGNWQRTVWQKQIVLCNFSENTLQIVSDKLFGKYGEKIIGIPDLLQWFSRSIPGNDFIFLRNYGIMNIQSQIVIPDKDPIVVKAVSTDGKYYVRPTYLGEDKDQNPMVKYYLNDVLLPFDTLYISGIDNGIYFTNDNRYLITDIPINENIKIELNCFTGEWDTLNWIPEEKRRGRELYIIDVLETITQRKMITKYHYNIQKKYCLFRSYTAPPMSNNSFPISFSYNRTDLADVYEMNFDGRILRKLRN